MVEQKRTRLTMNTCYEQSRKPFPLFSIDRTREKLSCNLLLVQVSENEMRLIHYNSAKQCRSLLLNIIGQDTSISITQIYACRFNLKGIA
jgi:hypothetical protein